MKINRDTVKRGLWIAGIFFMLLYLIIPWKQADASTTHARICSFQITSGPILSSPNGFWVKATANSCNYRYRSGAECVPLHGTTEYPNGPWDGGFTKSTVHCPTLYAVTKGYIWFPESNPVKYQIWPT